MDVAEMYPSKFFELSALILRGSGSGLVWLTSLMAETPRQTPCHCVTHLSDFCVKVFA